MVNKTFQCIADVFGGKAILTAFVYALPVGFLAVLLKHLQKKQLWGHDWGAAMIAIKAPAYASFVGILGFLIIFRTSAAYGRYTHGAHAIDHMRQAFFEVALEASSFLSLSTKAAPEVTNKLRKDIIRLISLLNALCYLELTKEESHSGVSEAQFKQFQVFDLAGIDAESVDEMKNNQAHHLEVVYAWVHSIISGAIQSGTISIAPPIAGRTLAKLAEGMSKFEDCRQTAFVAFPFPYSKATRWLLLVHMLVCPLYMCHLTTSDSLAPVGLFSFLQVFLLWSMQKVAQQLENPFGEDDSDIQLVSKQARFNEKLLVLWEPAHKPSFGTSSKTAETSAKANGSYSALAIQGDPRAMLSKFYGDNDMEPSTNDPGQTYKDEDDEYEELLEQ